MAPEDGGALFAWQGIQFRMPADWRPTALEGSRRSGYVRLEDAEAVRLEARWAPAAAGQPLPRIAEAHVRRLRAEARRLPFPTDTARISIEGLETEAFLLGADRPAMGMIARCGQCRRLVFVHVPLHSVEDALARRHAAEELSSLRDHARGGALPWSVYGFRLNTPEHWHLYRQEVAAGRMSMQFRARGVRASARRLRLAETLLSGRPFCEWAPEHAEMLFPGRPVPERPRPCRRGGHAAVEIEAPMSGHLFVARKRSGIACAWHCDETNSIYSVSADARPDRLDELDRFVRSVRCCDAMPCAEEGGP